MKRPARTFVVERRNGRKARPWFSEQPAVSSEMETSAAVREANDVFRTRDSDGALAKTDDAEAGIRVLQDLRASEPATEASAPLRGGAPRPKMSVVADDAPRRPRGRPRKVVPVVGDDVLAQRRDVPQPRQVELQFQAELPAPARQPVVVERQKVQSAPAAVPQSGVTDEIVAAVVAKVNKRVARTGRVRSAADLPVGQRWKRRLHPASW